MANSVRHVLEMTAEELASAIVAMGEPAFRGRQVAAWVWRKHVTSFAEMTDLPAELRGRLAADPELRILTARAIGRSDAADGTVKLLLELHDAECVEVVAIPEPRRLTACVSTQVGCAMACRFCATQLDGLKRNLSAGEIVEQVFQLQRAAERRVTHVVFMGMGEPLANYDATVSAIRAMVDPRRLGISARQVTVSTVGLPRQIRHLAGENLPITLAVSLHAPNDALRCRLMPRAATHSLGEIIEAADEFYQSRHREVTLEYVLLAGTNDSLPCADELARIAQRLRCNVNVIRYNPVPSLPFERPGEAATEAFAARLGELGVNAHVRRSRGLDVAAACGQLRQAAGSASTR